MSGWFGRWFDGWFGRWFGDQAATPAPPAPTVVPRPPGPDDGLTVLCLAPDGRCVVTSPGGGLEDLDARGDAAVPPRRAAAPGRPRAPRVDLTSDPTWAPIVEVLSPQLDRYDNTDRGTEPSAVDDLSPVPIVGQGYSEEYHQP